MNSTTKTTVVGVFNDRNSAKRAYEELRDAGFGEDRLGVVARDKEVQQDITEGDGTSDTATGAAIGVGTGAGLGALWGLGVVAGLLPAIGPVIAGGTLAAVLASAGVGAASAGIVGALIGLGVSEEEARDYERQVHSGRILITINAGDRYQEVYRIVQNCGGVAQAQPTITR